MDCLPIKGAWDPTDGMAARFHNEVVDYPDIDDVELLFVESEALPECFRCIGRAFIDWVESNGIILQTLEKLPTKVPEVISRRGNGRDGRVERQRVASYMKSAWTWILDRDTMQRHLEDNKPPRLVFSRVFEYEIMVPVPP